MPSFLGGRGLGGFQFSNLPGASLFSKSSVIGGPKYNLSGFAATGANKGMSGLTKGLIGGGALTALLGAAQEGDQEAIAATRDIGALKGYLSSYYENLGYKEEEIPAMVDRDTAEYSSSQGGYATGGRVGAMYGGRIGFKDGTDENLVGIETLKLGDYDLEGFQKKGRGNTLMFGSDDLKILSQALDYGELSDLSDRQKEKIKESIIRAKRYY